MLSRKKIFSFVFLCVTCWLHADFYPRENAFINHTSVYLQEEVVPGAARYELFYWRIGQRGASGQPKRAAITKTYPAFFISGLEWATPYFWLVKAYDASGKMIVESRRHVFRVVETRGMLPGITGIKLDVKTYKKELSSAGYIAIDYTRSIFDRDGNIVWVLPNIPGIVGHGTKIRDLKITRENTITFLTPDNAVEIDLDGNVLWKAPSPCYIDGDTMTYHHEFQKTKRGTYMVLVSRPLKRKLPESFHKEEILKADTTIEVQEGKCYKRTPVSMLVEFDKQGKLIWYWDSDKYLKDEDLAYKQNPNGTPVFLSHANTFSENEEASYVYVGFRDLSRIAKINKQKGSVEYSFGEKFPSGEAQTAKQLFRRQTSMKVTTHNTILIFNNNDAPEIKERLKTSGIVEINDKNTKDDKGLVWHYDIDFTDGNRGSEGGNICELSNGNILLCTGFENKILEIDRKGKLLWDARLMSFAPGDSVWRNLPPNRASWTPDLRYSYFYAMPQVRSNGSDLSYSAVLANVGTAKGSYLVEWLDGDKVRQTDEIKDLGPDKTNNLELKPAAGKPQGLLVLKITSLDSGKSEVFPFRS